jgi:GNAT superfamily N-acetyltransferase
MEGGKISQALSWDHTRWDGRLQIRGTMHEEKPGAAHVTIRSTIRPGDIGAITALHGIQYAAEYGWDHTFEAYVGEHLSVFARRYGGTRECIWIAERDRDLVGCIAIVENTSGDVMHARSPSHATTRNVAQVRWFIVRSDMRGKGVGRDLLARAVQFARDAGYGKIVLDTTSDLAAAARLYTAAGFRLAAESRSPGWGSEVVEQRYDLDLTRPA